ncbi:MAG: DUF4270 family protein [Algibacter sp.]
MTIKQVVRMPIILLSILFLILVSCEETDTDIPIGEDWFNLDTKVYFTDSMTVNVSTFKFDSIIVSNTDRLLVGAYDDLILGHTKSKTYAQLGLYEFDIDDEAVYDSIALILNYDNYFYNDTIPTQNLSVYEVIEDIKYIDDDEDFFYNTNIFAIDETSIGTKSFIAKPKKDDSLHVTLNNTFGKRLFDKIIDNDINNSDEFLDEHKGLLIEPDDSNTAVLGFLKTSFLRIYYTIEDESDNVEGTLDIAFNSTNSFHNITPSGDSNQETSIPSTALNNTSVIQSGTGLSTRIDIPNVEGVYDIPGTGTIVEAYLKLSLKENSSTDLLHTRDSLNVYIIDNKGDVVNTLTDYSGETALGIIESTSDEFNEITYSIPVAYFLDLKLTEINGDELYLAIYSQDFNQSVDRYILNGEDADTSLKAKLELTYAIYDE